MRLPIRSASGDRERGEIDLAPSKIIGVGRNYRAHAEELGHEAPTEPLLFLKATSAMLEPGGAIVRPSGFERVDFEGELAVVIGKDARGVAEADASDYIRGYTCANDVTVRDLQKRDKQWIRAKGLDTFCPLGPVVVESLDPTALAIETRINGEVRQRSTTARMLFSIPQLIEYISQYMTLRAGDVILTGTPAGVGNLEPGDRVEVEIAGIGVLENPVAAAPDA